MASATTVGQLGGAAEHTHSIAHVHKAQAQPTTDLVQPLGLHEVTSDAKHGHEVLSYATTPAVSSPASNLPPAFGLQGFLVKSLSPSSIPENLIIGYVGAVAPPAGWLLCDGSNGAPDLRERFILLGPAYGPVGDAAHEHAADHSHAWSSADNPDKPAFFRDIVTPVDPKVTVAARVHHHTVGAETVSQGHAQSAPNAPPSVGLSFYMAGKGVKTLPKGAVLALDRKNAPMGWRRLQDVGDATIEGRLLKAAAPASGPTVLEGGSTHDHVLTTRHAFSLEPEAGAGGEDRQGPAPAVPKAGHRHVVIVEETLRTGLAENWPLSVALLVIVKQ